MMSEHNGKQLILIVDDTPENIDVLAGTLRSKYEIKAAINGEKALKIANADPKPDMILLDLMMPGMDGHEVCRRLKADPATFDIPVIFITGKDEVSDEKRGFELGAVDYITRPMSPPIVLSRIKTHLQLYDQNRALEEKVRQRTAELEGSRREIIRSEAHLRTLIGTLPDLVWLKDPKGGYLACNAKFERFFGATEDEIIGKTDYDFVDREMADSFKEKDQAAMDAGKPCVNEEEVTYADDGHREFLETIKTPMYDMEGNMIGVLGVGRDITDRMRKEKVQAAKLRLFEYAASHTVIELLQKFLDEAEVLSGSEMGFIHFVEDDQKTLGLQTWSTNTLKNKCTAAGSEQHYPISEAGVWVDCFHERKSVFHNDYASLPQKKGLPDGHAPITRELVVPIIRGEKIVAIVGVGNKASNYDEEDVKAILQLAELTWETVVRRRAEEALRESEAKFRGLVESSSDWIWEVNAEGVYTYASPQIEEILGYRPEEVIGKTPFDMMPSNEAQRTEGIFKELVGAGKPFITFENVCLHKDSRHIVLETSGVPIPDAAGKIIGYRGVDRDITRRKRAEEELFRAAQEWQITFDTTNDAIWILDQDMRIQRANKKSEQLFYRPDSKMIGKHCWEIAHGTEQPIPGCPNLRSRHSLCRETMDLQIGESWFQVIVDPILDTSSGYIGSVHIVTDITERKRAEEALRESEEKYRSMMESMKDAAYFCSAEFRIEYMNPRMISRIGHDATGELCHKAIYDKDEKCSWCVIDQVQQGEHIEYEFQNPRDNRYYSITNSPVYHYRGAISKLTISRDITNHKAIEAQLRQKTKMESIGTLAGGIAHDFNNLLYIITGNAELALCDVPEWNTVHAELEEIKATGLRAAGIVKQLLNFSRKTDQELKPIGAITVIKDALKFLRSTFPANIEIRTQLPDAEVRILADATQINQVLMNICTNASQAMEETGGVLEINVENKPLAKDSADVYPDLTAGDYVKITISDTGPGIDPEITDRIFDPYFTTKEVGKGSGMGLAVAHGIVKNHSGSITMDSEPGKGATFTILFPVVS